MGIRGGTAAHPDPGWILVMDLWNPALVIYGCPLQETGGNINPSILLGTLSAVNVNGQDLGGEIFPSDCWLPAAAVLVLETVTELWPEFR